MEALEGSIREKEKLNALLKTTLDSIHAELKPSVQTADTGIQSQKLPTVDPVMHTEPTAPRSKARSDSPSKKFPRRGLRSHSPRTSSGDLMDSSLDNEMRAAGVDVNDSFDSSEGVGFSDTNVESSVLGSDHSLVTREEGGDPSVVLARKKSQQVDSSPHRTAWAEDGTDQAQAKHSNDVHISVNGEGVPSSLGEGLGSGEIEEEVGGSGRISDREVSADKGMGW